MSTNQEKKVSIIVPIYKSEAFLPRLIESMLNQTYTNIEVILVDDESPDNSGKICDDYEKRDKRVIVIHQKNKGCCEARNVGLRESTGDYIMLVDGDDWMELDCVEYLVSLLESNNCEMSMSDRVTNSETIRFEPENIKVMTPEEAACAILYVKTPVGPWNKLYSNSVIMNNNISFSVPWFGEGLYFSVMNAQLSKSVVMGHKCIYHYRMNNPNSGTTVRDVQHAINSLWNIKNIRENLVVKTPDTIKACNWHYHRNLFNLLWYINEGGEGVRKEYNDLYIKSLKELKSLTLRTAIESKISFVQKILVLFTGYMPSLASKLATIRRKRKFRMGGR